MRLISIATRKSELALWQARWTQTQLENLGHSSELVLVETQGDKDNRDFSQIEGQGFFTKAVQDKLITGEADLAVHSFKDLPSAPHPELEIGAVSERADPRDVLIINKEAFEQKAPLPLKEGANVGTSAVRRQEQLLQLQPDLKVSQLRGNVPTRIEKLQNKHYGAIVLAAAGVERLNLDVSNFHVQYVESTIMIPAPAQGVLALECRRDAYELASILTDIHDVNVHKCVAAERGLMAMLQGGCQLALGAYAVLKGGQVELTAWYEGQKVTVQNPSSEGVAMLAFEALGRPHPRE